MLPLCSHNEIGALMKPHRYYCFDAATIRLLHLCCNKKGFASMKPQQGVWLDATTALLPRYNDIVSSMNARSDIFVTMLPQGCWFDTATMRLLPRCRRSETVASMQPQRACYPVAATTRLMPQCSHKEWVCLKQSYRDCFLDAATAILLP